MIAISTTTLEQADAASGTPSVLGTPTSSRQGSSRRLRGVLGHSSAEHSSSHPNSLSAAGGGGGGGSGGKSGKDSVTVAPMAHAGVVIADPETMSLLNASRGWAEGGIVQASMRSIHSHQVTDNSANSGAGGGKAGSAATPGSNGGGGAGGGGGGGGTAAGASAGQGNNFYNHDVSLHGAASHAVQRDGGTGVMIECKLTICSILRWIMYLRMDWHMTRVSGPRSIQAVLHTSCAAA